LDSKRNDACEEQGARVDERRLQAAVSGTTEGASTTEMKGFFSRHSAKFRLLGWFRKLGPSQRWRR